MNVDTHASRRKVFTDNRARRGDLGMARDGERDRTLLEQVPMFRPGLLSAPLAMTLAACIAGPVLHDNTGDAKQLSFDGPRGTIAVGYPTTFSVMRLEDGVAACTGAREGKCVGTGSGPRLALVDARCDDGACNVEDVSDGTGLELRVTGTRAGSTKLRVRTRAIDGDGAWEDATTVSFAAADAIAVRRMSTAPVPVHDPGFPGATFSLCISVESAGHALVVGPDAISASIDGGVARFDPARPDPTAELTGVDRRCGWVTLVAPGSTSLSVVAKELTANVPLAVADPNDVTGVELAEARTDLASDASATDAQLSSAPPVTSLDLAHGRRPPDLVVTARLRDGRRALGGAGYVRSENPAVLLAGSSVTTAAGAEWTQASLDLRPLAAGATAIVLQQGSLSLRVPVTITQ